jgi:hypothetical protein
MTKFIGAFRNLANDFLKMKNFNVAERGLTGKSRDWGIYNLVINSNMNCAPSLGI